MYSWKHYWEEKSGVITQNVVSECDLSDFIHHFVGSVNITLSVE